MIRSDRLTAGGTWQMVRQVFVVVVLLTSLNVATAGPPPDGDNHGIPPNESATLWARDSDQYVTDAQYQNLTGENRTAVQALLNGTDYTWTSPPRLPSEWNQRDWAAYARNFSTTRNQSVHPTDAQLSQSQRGWIQDAHATLYRLQPSTRLYQAPNQTIHYIAPDGRVRGLVDYRVQTPDNDTDDTDGKTVRWTLQHHEISAVCVAQGPDNPEEEDCQRRGVRIGATSSPNHTVNVSYAARKHAEPGTPVSLVAVIEVEMNKTVETKHQEEVEKCHEVETRNGTKTVCETETETWWTSNSTQVTDRVTVTDQVAATIYQLRTAVRTATFPDDDRGVIVQSSEQWGGIGLGPDASLRTPWRYFAARNPEWDQLATTTADGSTWDTSPAVPVRVYAFPSTSGVSWESDSGDVRDVRVLDGRQHASPAPALPENVSVSVVAQEYNTTQTLAVRYNGPTDQTTATGVVRGVDGDVVQSGEPVDIRRANLTLSVVNWNTTYVNVKVTLRENRTGAPINTTGREGYVEIREDVRVQTNGSGEAVVTLQNTGMVTATYEPGDWWSGEKGYLRTQARVLPRSGLFGASSFGRILSNLLKLSIPPLVVLYLLDQLPGGETWPPWRLLQ